MCRFPTPQERILAIIITTDVRNQQSFAGMLSSSMDYLNLSNTDAAALAQVTPADINDWEHGYTAPAIPKREAVKNLLRAAVESEGAIVPNLP